MPGPSAVPIVLSEDERAELLRRAAGPGVWRADRARIILACAGGMSNAAAAQALGVAVKSVSKWRRQFAGQRLAGLEDAAPVGRRKAELVLDEAERAQLVRWSRRAKTAQYLALRAKIVLRCAEGGTNGRAAADLGVDESTVERWRARFIAGRLEGLHDEPRPGRPPSILPGQVEDVVVATLETAPGKDTHWSRASMARRTGLSKSTIGRIWKKSGLKPRLQDSFKLSADPFFAGEGRRRRGALPQPAREGGGAVRGREVAGPGAGPVPAGAADDARHARAAHPRLRPPRRDQPVRRLRHRRRHRDQRAAPPAPPPGVPEVPQEDRQERPGRPRRPPGL